MVSCCHNVVAIKNVFQVCCNWHMIFFFHFIISWKPFFFSAKTFLFNKTSFSRCFLCSTIPEINLTLFSLSAVIPFLCSFVSPWLLKKNKGSFNPKASKNMIWFNMPFLHPIFGLFSTDFCNYDTIPCQHFFGGDQLNLFLRITIEVLENHVNDSDFKV